ncbi:MAG: hypothetical protein K6G52_08385 [Treponemataceae bacterium]|nr:hypothetical protein [Treponemataceae bacterium]
MACDPIGENDRRKNQFFKIRLWNNMAQMIAYFAFQRGNGQVFDYIDMNCGGIPEGEFEQVIDLSAPHQFLSMYTQVAEKRFAFAVTELLKMNGGYIDALSDFCRRTGRELNADEVDDAEKAFELMKSFVLDGMPCDETKEVVSVDERKIEWKKLTDTHAEAWNKAGGDLSVYYRLQKDFVDGLLEKSHITLHTENYETFWLERE